MNDEMLHAYLDGELSPEAASHVESALASDAALATRLHELMALDDAIGTLPGIDAVSHDFTDRLLERVRASRRPGRILRFVAPLAVAAAILVAVVAVLRHESPEPVDVFDEADYVDYRWEVDTDTFGSLALTDLESEVLKELKPT